MTANRLILPGLLLLAGVAGCGKDLGQNPPSGTPLTGAASLVGEVPNFALTDVNPTSPTYNQPVSPRDELGKVSAWYFGHAT